MELIIFVKVRAETMLEFEVPTPIMLNLKPEGNLVVKIDSNYIVAFD